MEQSTLEYQKKFILTPDEILLCVSRGTNVPVSDIIKTNRQPGARKRDVVTARQITIYLIVDICKKSKSSAGVKVNRDHATSIHSIKTLKDLLTTDREVKRLFYKVMQECYQKNDDLINIIKEQDKYLEKYTKTNTVPEAVNIKVNWVDSNGEEYEKIFHAGGIHEARALINLIAEREIEKQILENFNR